MFKLEEKKVIYLSESKTVILTWKGKSERDGEAAKPMKIGRQGRRD